MLKSIKDEIRLFKAYEQLWTKVKRQTSHQVWNKVRDKVEEKVGNQVEDQACNQV